MTPPARPVDHHYETTVVWTGNRGLMKIGQHVALGKGSHQ